MDGKQILSQMKRLREVESIKDVRPLTAAMFPGAHCPLMGAAMTVRGIKDSMMLIIGTDECAYYTKHMTLGSEEYGGLMGRVVSVTLDGHDVTFGCVKKVESAFAELMEEYHPACVFLVTTCVVEIIGDDFDACAAHLSERYGLPVMAVHTEHFKCENHLPGLERAITACFGMMVKQPCDKRVNLLGQRMGDFNRTELCRILKESGVNIGMQLPCGCTVEEIRAAAAARMNIVVNEIALPLAEKMQAAFGIPYVFFDKLADPGHIAACYRQLFDMLALPLPPELAEMHRDAVEAIEGAKSELAGVTFIYGNTPLRPFEFSRFMVDLGMEPQVIQTNAITQQDRPDITAILEKADPYVTKNANIAPLQYVYDELHPMLYLGHEFAARLRAKGIALAHVDQAGRLLGYEVTRFVLDELLHAARECRTIRQGGGER